MIRYDIEQGTPEWHLLRLGLPTASEFGKLVTPVEMKPSKQSDDYARTLAAELWTGELVDSFTGNAFTENGKASEEAARLYYAMLTHRSVETAGFIMNDELGAGASPDGLMLGDAGALEIKSCGAKRHIQCLGLSECPREYRAQCQGILMVGEPEGIQWVDLLMYAPNLPCKVFHVEPDLKYQAALRKQLALVRAERDRYYDIIEGSA